MLHRSKKKKNQTNSRQAMQSTTPNTHTCTIPGGTALNLQFEKNEIKSRCSVRFEYGREFKWAQCVRSPIPAAVPIAPQVIQEE